METTVSFKQLEPSDAIRAYAEEKSARLEKYFNGNLVVSWNFSVERQNQIAHCHTMGNHINIFAEEVTSDLYASIDGCVKKIEEQLRKHKEIVKDHVHNMGSEKGADRYVAS